MIKVIVNGAAGRMGSQTVQAVIADQELRLVGACDSHSDNEQLKQLSELGVAAGSDLEEVLEAEADVMVDFTHASTVVRSAALAADKGTHIVIGTTGLTAADVEELREIAANRGVNVLIAPNFAIGAVLMIRLAEEAARYAERAEIVELHHDGKADAPSGTSLLTAERLSQVMSMGELAEEEKLPGARGASDRGVHIHSVRLPGLVAHQEVILGFQGQTLTIRHDSIDRSCFMPGVVMAIKQISGRPGLTVGLDKYMFPGD